jgi:uncharacterized protein with PIN domain
MIRPASDDRCGTCGGVLVPPTAAFEIIVPAGADFVCSKCRRAYRWEGSPPRLTALVAAK